MIKYLISGIMCLLLATGYSQGRLVFPACKSVSFSCPEYQKMLSNVYDLLADDQGFEAYEQFQLLESCDDCPEHQELLNQLGREVLDGVAKIVDEQSHAQLEALRIQSRKNQAISQRLRQTNELIEQQLAENEQMTREALATNFMSFAKEKYNQNDANGFDAALWLTDFTYAYIDSTHQDVQQMMYRLFYQRMADNLPYTFYDSPDDEDASFFYDESITAMTWSSDSLWLAIGTSLNQVIVFSEEGEMVFTFSPDTGTEIFSLDWNKNNNILAVASSNKVDLITYEKKQWQRLDQYIYRADYVRVIRWSPTNSQLLAIAGDENKVFVYERSWEQPKQTFTAVHNDWIRALDWSPDGKHLASGDDDGRIVFWEYNESNVQVLSNQIVHSDYIRSIDWHPTQDTIASAADNGLILFQNESGTVIDNQTVDELILKLAYSPSGQKLGVLSIDNNFTLIEDHLIVDQKSVPSNVQSFDWLGEDNTISDGGLIENIRDSKGHYPTLFQVNSSSNEQLSDFELNEEKIYLSKWSPDGEILAYTQSNQLFVKQRNKLDRVTFVNNEIYDIDWHPGLSAALPNSNFFATIDSDSILAVWDAIEVYIEKNISLPTNATVVKWTPDGKELIVGDTEGYLWRYNNKLEFLAKYPVQKDQINDLAWSPDGKYLAITSEDKTAVVWDYFQEEEKAYLRGHKDWIQQVVWLNDEELATCGDDQQLIIWTWDATKQTYEVKQRLTDLNGTYQGLDVERGSRFTTLAAGTYKGELGIWQRSNNSPQDTFELNSTQEYQSDFSELSWHPSGSKLLFSSYSYTPEMINFRLEVEPVFSLDNLNLSDRVETKLGRIQYSTLKRHFYLPEIKITSQQPHLLQWSADERLMAFADQKTLEVHDFNARELVHTHTLDQQIDFLTFSPDHSWLAVVDQNALLAIWSTTDWESPFFIPLNNIDITYWVWSADSRYLAILTADFKLLLYDLENRSLTEKDLPLDIIGEGTMLFHPTDNQLIYVAICVECYADESSFFTGSSYLFEVDWRKDKLEAREIIPKRGSRQEVNNRADNTINMQWADDSGQHLIVQLHNEPLYLVKLGSDPKVLQAFGYPNTISGPYQNLVYEYVPMDRKEEPFKSAEREYIKFWDPFSGQVERKLLGIRKQLTQQLAISEEAQLVAGLGPPLLLFEGKYIIAQQAAISLNVWEMNEQTEFLSLPVDGAVNIDFSPQGNYIILHFENGRVAVWPVDISAIASFLNNAGKDRFFSQANKKQIAFQNRIEEWGLERGLNVAPTQNMERLIRRESPELRAEWSAFFLEEAWLADEEEVAETYFSKALQLHVDKNGSIRESKKDSLAVADIYLDQTYFYLAKEKFRTARGYLQAAQKKLPSVALLDQISTMLSWQEGAQESVFIRMNNQDNKTLTDAYERFEIRDLALHNNIFFDRLLSTHLQLWDPGLDKLNQPSMQQLLVDFEKTEVRRFLEKYYLINHDNTNIGPILRQQLLQEAVDFFGDESMPVNQTARLNYLNNVLLLNDELIISLIQNKEYEQALTHANTSVLTSQAILKTDIRDNDYISRYFYDIKLRGILMAIDQPNNLIPIYQMIANSETFAKNKNNYHIQLLRGHLSMLENENNKALRIYFEILNDLNNDYDLIIQVSDQIKAELQLLRKEQTLTDNLHRQLIRYQNYQYNMLELGRLINERNLSPYLTGETLRDALEKLLATSKMVIADGQSLLSNGLIPTGTHKEQLLAFNRISSELAWHHLQNDDFEQAQQVIEQSKDLLPDARWPNAVYAVILSTQEDKFALKNALFVCRIQKNDGYNSNVHPTLKQLLAITNLPDNISQHPVFLKNRNIWEDGLK